MKFSFKIFLSVSRAVSLTTNSSAEQMRIYKVNYLPKSRLDRTFDKSIPVSNSAKNCHREHCSIISMVNNRLIEHTLDNQVPVENKHIESQWKITLIIENGCFRDYVKLKF